MPALAMAQAHFHKVQADLREPYRVLTKAIPDVMAGYGALHDAAFVEGTLDIKTKELIALSIAITREVRRVHCGPRPEPGPARRHCGGGRRNDRRRYHHERRPRAGVGAARPGGLPGVQGRTGGANTAGLAVLPNLAVDAADGWATDGCVVPETVGHVEPVFESAVRAVADR